MSFDDQWAGASAEGPSNDSGPPPEGAYDVALIGASAFVSKGGNEIVKLELRVVSTKEQGYEWTQIYGFSNQGAASAAKTTCAKIGVDVESIDSFAELDKALAGQVGNYYEVDVVKKGEYLNTYFQGSTEPTDAQRAVGGTDPGPEPGDPGFDPDLIPVEDDDDDVPF